jgi:hypothetical protein
MPLFIATRDRFATWNQFVASSGTLQPYPSEVPSILVMTLSSADYGISGATPYTFDIIAETFVDYVIDRTGEIQGVQVWVQNAKIYDSTMPLSGAAFTPWFVDNATAANQTYVFPYHYKTGTGQQALGITSPYACQQINSDHIVSYYTANALLASWYLTGAPPTT